MLPDHLVFVAGLRSMVDDFLKSVPTTLEPADWDAYARTVDNMRIDNFGSVGTRMLLDSLGIRDVSAEFRAHGMNGKIPRYGRLTAALDECGDGISWFRTRVVNYFEYELELREEPTEGYKMSENSLGEEPACSQGGAAYSKVQGGGQKRRRLHGAEVGENAYHGEVTGDSRWLRATTPPFNPFADRRTCSEFRSFDRLLDGLAAEGMAADVSVRSCVYGHISLLINAPPCVSCIGVVRQFQLLFPNVQLRMSGGRPVPFDIAVRGRSRRKEEGQKEVSPGCDTLELGDFGFVERLHVPSSGIMLGWATFEGLCLRMLWRQLEQVHLRREYLLLSHDALGHRACEFPNRATVVASAEGPRAESIASSYDVMTTDARILLQAQVRVRFRDIESASLLLLQLHSEPVRSEKAVHEHLVSARLKKVARPAVAVWISPSSM
eukprot:gnl/TRDRNA2_/TRDRNA2_174050_c3_seq1.p1 gnl/TRDRNA2_/TRDRNA2_174050_c3~~gnl/TRDRNA2_/TRDRNA2_174050_c3_seq1.p1  ORF type:complete len:437 (+),score=64.00 gnl/TRDRNA2_/TRDRNA2_174050_c3_seq1:500-1810(+)